MKFLLTFLLVSYFFSHTVFAQNQSLEQKMHQEKILLSREIEQDTLNVRKDWNKISTQISELFTDLDIYDKSIYPNPTDTVNSNGIIWKGHLLITGVKNQLIKCNVGILKMEATLLLQKIQGGHDKEINDLRKRILNDSKELNAVWKQLFPD